MHRTNTSRRTILNSNVFRLYVERKPGFENEARQTLHELTNFVGITNLTSLRYFNRYDIQGLDQDDLNLSATRIFSEAQSDTVYFEDLPLDITNDHLIAVEYLPGQYDQRADSAQQCLSLLLSNKTKDANPIVRCARVYAFKGKLSSTDLQNIQNYLVNPVDSHIASLTKPKNLELNTGKPQTIETIKDFINLNQEQISTWHAQKNLAMDKDDVLFLQEYFKKENRNPTETEIRVLDTYWSDHCRHTTFNTILETIDIDQGPYAETFKRALSTYTGLRADLYQNREDKPLTLMDMAVIGAKALKNQGFLKDIEESAEINACSLFITVNILDKNGDVSTTEPWLLMFKNETHNHPTEIEPFGGAATCIGGAIRDPLSGRAWVYQALRVTGAGDPTRPITDTLPGKLPQIKLTREAAAGFSAYGNQIGLTTGQVHEFYHPGFLAKRMELGAVIAASPVSSVIREEPSAGDLVILVGGGTGRDGIGGATGSSKAHTSDSVATAGAEVQKGNAVEERKIQRLFRNSQTTRLIKRCNDFGAGGVAVAVGELAPGLNINLDAVPKKYEGLNGTELAISESQERMAVVVKAKDAETFIQHAHLENLNAAIIAQVTDKPRLVMTWQGSIIVDIDRAFLDTAGAKRSAQARISQPSPTWQWLPKNLENSASLNLNEKWKALLSDLSCASQRGLKERFDGSIGSSSVLFPMGGAYQSTPECGMASRIPVGPEKTTNTASLMTMGYNPQAASWSPFHGAQYAVLESLTKILALGGDPQKARLSFQEYFERTSSNEAWGKPAAALLGALEAQMNMKTASIGGKDSMSGTFHDLTVPPSLVSFAVSTIEDKAVRGGSFKTEDSKIVFVHSPWLSDGTPDWDQYKKNVERVLALSSSIKSAYPIGSGGIAQALALMSFGNRIGAKLDINQLSKINLPEVLKGEQTNLNIQEQILFAPLVGSLIIEVDKASIQNINSHANFFILGFTQKAKEFSINNTVIPLDALQMAWEKPLAKVFPPVSQNLANYTLPEWAIDVSLPQKHTKTFNTTKEAKPLVVLPVFPGTNCEYDMARAFNITGAETRIIVLRNRTTDDLKTSIDLLTKQINQAHILAFSGGFSSGDEPDGSGKFIANVIREQKIADAIMQLIEVKKGLILGICNGFQALIKTGLLPYGKILPINDHMPTLTYNTIGRHVSRFVSTRMSSDSSPWAQGKNLSIGTIHTIPISHGEGRIIIDADEAKTLFSKGQVFSQYVDSQGKPTMIEPENPNGSMYAIEGLTSPCGLILGKMGHSERPIDLNAQSARLYNNIPGNTSQDIFSAGVTYWTH